jgi:hypothetical protein
MKHLWLSFLALTLFVSSASGSVIDYGPPQDSQGHWEFDLYDSSNNQRGTSSNPFYVGQYSAWTTGRTWTLLNTTDSVNSVQSGTWTVQQGSAPWSVSQSGTWTVQEGSAPWSVVGNVASGSSDSGNGVKTGAVAVTNTAGLPSVSSGNRVDNQADLNGRQYVTNAPLDGAKATYSASITGLVPAATSPTAIFTITGSATTTVRVTQIRITATQTSAAEFSDVLLVKRSAADTSGTSTAPTRVPLDSNDAAATATVLAYTANPTLGAAVGTIRTTRLMINVPNPSSAQASEPQVPIIWEFGNRPSQAVVLRGTAQVLAVNLNAVSLVSAANFAIYVEWTEE